MGNKEHKSYNKLLGALKRKEKLMAVLFDPENFQAERLPSIIDQLHNSVVTHIFVGGSTVKKGKTEALVKLIKPLTHLPVFIFPGDEGQITPAADALLFLMLLSGRNPEYLIETQIRSAAILREHPMETISTGYILIDGGKETTVQRVSKTLPIPLDNISLIGDTAMAGELLGNKLIYLEAGSGSKHPVSKEVIKYVKKSISVPLIVGGGIRSINSINEAYNAGADMLVIGTAFEKDTTFFQSLNYLIVS